MPLGDREPSGERPMAGELSPAPGRHPVAFAPDDARRRGRRRWATLTVVAVVVAGLTALLGVGLKRDPSVIRSVLVNRRAPPFALQTLDGGGIVHLSQFRGHPVVINFWASWCADCRLEHPSLVAAAGRFAPQGVVFLGVIFEDTPANATKFIRELGSDGVQLLDPNGRTAIDYGVYGIPETFFIGPDGVIVGKKIGPSSYPFLVTEIGRLLGSRTQGG
jgi:cytochrome c biogenesis protein CcmG/thiol:disulfide interchange protein DsbE